MNTDLEEAILAILEQRPKRSFMWIHRRLIKDGVRKWMPGYSMGHLLGALHRMDIDGFVFSKDGDWSVNG